MAVAAAALASSAAPTPGDELVLEGGGTILVDLWWEEGGVLYYETDAGTVGIPRDQVVEIRTSRADTPRMRAESGDRTSSSAAEARRSKAPPDEERLSATIERLETDLRRAGTDASRERLSRGLADMLVLRARGRLAEADRRDEAIADYERALVREPEHRVALIELGWLELRRGRPRRAATLAERGLAAHPGDGLLLELRGQVLYEENRLRDALEDFAAALRARPGNARLQGRIEKVRRDLAAEHGYDRSLSSHFVLRFDGARDESIGDALLEALESAWDELTERLETYPVEPITVILYSSQQFQETTGSGADVAGLFDGKIRLPIGGLERVTPGVERVLRHELAHALLHVKSAGAAPRWLHEGLAQLMEPRSVEVADARLRSGAEAPALAPFSYAKALSFCGFLSERDSFGRLLWLVELLAEGAAEDDAFRRAFGKSRDRLGEEWRETLKRAD